jgi:hypothetical protein
MVTIVTLAIAIPSASPESECQCLIFWQSTSSYNANQTPILIGLDGPTLQDCKMPQYNLQCYHPYFCSNQFTLLPNLGVFELLLSLTCFGKYKYNRFTLDIIILEQRKYITNPIWRKSRYRMILFKLYIKSTSLNSLQKKGCQFLLASACLHFT